MEARETSPFSGFGAEVRMQSGSWVWRSKLRRDKLSCRKEMVRNSAMPVIGKAKRVFVSGGLEIGQADG